MTSEKLDGAFRRALELDSGIDPASLAYRSIPQWDSIGHITLIAELESTYDVMFSSDDVLALSSYAKAVELLKANGVDEV